jgi:hypothetical protein
MTDWQILAVRSGNFFEFGGWKSDATDYDNDTADSRTETTTANGNGNGLLLGGDLYDMILMLDRVDSCFDAVDMKRFAFCSFLQDAAPPWCCVAEDY